jgi:hypothetical protein
MYFACYDIMSHCQIFVSALHAHRFHVQRRVAVSASPKLAKTKVLVEAMEEVLFCQLA